MKALGALGLLVALVLSSCGDGRSSTVVTDDDSGAEIAVSSGDSIEVRLGSNPSTGYSWQLDDRSVAAFTRIGPAVFESVDVGDVVGASGVEVFTIEIVEQGAGVVRFEYLRPFDDPPIPERVVEYILRADGAPWPPVDTDEPPTVDTSRQGR